jgi:hypothetical protein
MLKYLRIAVTALCLAACVLLIALWIRSYRVQDVVYGWFPFPGYLQINSTCGDIKIIANAEKQEAVWRYNSRAPEARGRNWFFNLEQHNRFGWWLDITVPHWSLSLALAGLAALISVHWSRRFSLRTLLIATTVVAVGLGLIVYLAG